MLIVDTDMRRPRIHKSLAPDREFGITNIIVGGATEKQAIHHTKIEGVDFLPCGPIPPNPAELIHTKAFRDLLERMSERYDLVIFDSPPVNAVADALVLSTLVDGVVFVVNAGTTMQRTATASLKRLHRH